MGARVSIQLLGPVHVEVAGAPLAVDTRKATALLAYLAVTGRPQSRESLAALLWPEADSADARAALRRTLSVLNAGLGAGTLAIDRASVALREGQAEADLARFRAMLGRARGHRHESDKACPSCITALEVALALDRGEFMSGFALRDSEAFDEWQVAEAESHRRDLAGALERLARSLAAAGATERALAAGRRWLELDPLHEPAHRLLMQLLATAGEPAAAIGQYRDCVRILDQELGVAPLPETTELYEAIRANRLRVARLSSVQPTGAGVPIPTPPLPLAGRDRELATFRDVHRSVGPDGRLVVVEGEPGIGKSRLAAEMAGVIREAGGIVVEARAFPGEATIALAPISELIRIGLDRPGAESRLQAVRSDLRAEVARLVPLPHLANAESRPAGPVDPFSGARIVEGIAEVLTALVSGRTAGLIVVDDLNRADDSSLSALAYIARRLRGRPILLLVTWRAEEMDDEVRNRITAAAESDGLAVRIRLGRLDLSAVTMLALAALGADGASVAETLFTESEGLPLYVAEALASPIRGNGPTPGGVAALLRSRIEATGVLAHQVLSAAATIGRSFELQTVRLASGRGEEETIAGLEELVRRGLIVEVEPNGAGDIRYDFSHGRLRDVAYESIGLARRRLLHRRVAEALRSGGAPRDDATRWSLIAFHEELAGRSPEAAVAHRLAGEHARAVSANPEAREHLEAAIALGDPNVAELHESLADVLTLLGDYAAAISHLEVAAALAGPDRRATIDHRLGLVHARRGDWSRADDYLVGALASVPEADTAFRSAVLADRSAIAHRSGGSSAARELAEDALRLAKTTTDLQGVARAEDLLGILARGQGDLAAAMAHLERSYEAALASSDPGPRIAAMNSLALVHADLGNWSRALELTGEALVLCERQGDRHRQAALENNLADLLRADGRHDEAMEHLKRAVAIFADIGGQPDELQPEIWKLIEW
jgi:DNA-binding SARP family transcriptional activator/Tfp pilus assembly protein PilF/energy-coupling factor transporter ATP-binding protein EcfA2